MRGPFELSAAVSRKLRQLIQDPVLRTWVFERAIGRAAPPPRLSPPRYVDPDIEPSGDCDALQGRSKATGGAPARDECRIEIMGRAHDLTAGGVGELFAGVFDDNEMRLAVHRFAWLPVMGAAVDPAWVERLWVAWMDGYSWPDAEWHWHPYTAAERAINIIDYIERHGVIGPPDRTARVLASHAEVIADRLEYFGEHNTSNHLCNNGRGLYRIGLALGIEWAARLGADILLGEAKRIFLPSGIMREGSGHYHLLYTQRYLDAWLAARASNRGEAEELSRIASRAVAALRGISLGGRLPLIGDVSPDSPPAHLGGLLTGERTGWIAGLGKRDRDDVLALAVSAPSVDADQLRADGWLRWTGDDWAGLWHAAPDGWSAMPGHGHQDTGSFDLRVGGERLFADPGRGAYGETGEAARYRSAATHNTLMIDNMDPYPANKPYYDDAFRRRICGPVPVLEKLADGVRLTHHGYSRRGGIGAVTRRWAFRSGEMRILDRVEGLGRHLITRLLVTPHRVERRGDAVLVDTGAGRFEITGSAGGPTIDEVTLWHAYGEGAPGSRIRFDEPANLDWEGQLRVMAV